MSQRILLAAGIIRDIKFLNRSAADYYLNRLVHSCINYEVLDSCECQDGCVILRIVQQYNNSPLIEL